MEQPLYSERSGRGRQISSEDLAELVWRHLGALRDNTGLLAEAITGYVTPKGGGRVGRPPRIVDLESFLLERVRVGGLSYSVREAGSAPYRAKSDPDVLLDILELLYRDCVSLPANRSGEERQSHGDLEEPFDRSAGRDVFRARLNPLLKLATPPYEIDELGRARTLPAAGHEALVRADIPADEEQEISDPVEAAIDSFFRRGATVHDRLSAVKLLADALERLRPDVKAELLPADEQALFQIANGFGIRHLNRGQKLDYDRERWLEWMFYVYLATARTVMSLRAEDRERQNTDQAESDISL